MAIIKIFLTSNKINETILMCNDMWVFHFNSNRDEDNDHVVYPEAVKDDQHN